MEKIGIIGAPESGKSDLAQGLKQALEEKGKKVVVIDDYIPEIEEESDIVLGRASTYVGDSLAMFGRFARENKALLEKPDYMITVGTLLDTTVYAALGGVKDQTPEGWFRVHNWMNLAGIFFRDTWKYDHTFLLMLPAKVEEGEYLDGIKEDFNNHVLDAIESFKIEVKHLQGSTNDQLATALEELEKPNEPATP